MNCVMPPWRAVEAGTDLLARARQIQRRWDRLLGEGALGAELSPEATAGLRPTIAESWRRAVATGLEPIDVLPAVEEDPSETRERWLEHPLGLLRHVLAEPLQMLAEESNSLVQVTDASGLTLYLGGAEWLKELAAEMNLVEGARCSETVNGTNGVGTALAADHPVQVFAFEHFSYHHREWVCSGAPIHDPVSGRLVGVIDLSSPWRIAHPRSLELVTTAAGTTEQCLLQGRRDHDARLTRRYGDLTTKSTDLLVNREGYVLIGDDSAGAKPLDVPESGGEIALDDGSLAVAEPVGQGEAISRSPTGITARRRSTGRGGQRAEGRAGELARKRAARSRAREPGRAGEVESGLPSPGAGERISAYLEAAIDCVIVADASGRIVEFNPAAERTFGYSRKEAVGRTMAELIVPPSLRERHIAAFARFVKTREGRMLGRRVELTGMRADGSEFPVELALSQVEAEPVLICGALRDISAAKQAENRLGELAEEQAALRQVATLVAYESSPDRLVAVVAEQVARYSSPVGQAHSLRAERRGRGRRLQRDAMSRSRSVRAGSSARRAYWQRSGIPAVPRASRTTRTRPATAPVRFGRQGCALRSGVRLSSEEQCGARSASLAAKRIASRRQGARLADFTELLATALANAESRAALSQLADEQAALRRVATLVAREASPVELLASIAEEVARVLDVEAVGILRFEPDGTATLVAQSDTPWDPPPLGTRFRLEGENVVTAVFRTREAARLDDWATATGPVGDMARVLGIRSSVATPIVVEGRLWGTLIAVTSQSEPLPRETDSRIGEFTELVATAIANAGARDELAASEARARDLASEQAALRRVATLVATGVSSDELFAAVTREAADVLDVPVVALQRYEADRMFTMVAIAGETRFSRSGVVARRGRGAGREDPRHRAPRVQAGLHDDAGTAGRRLERQPVYVGGRRPDRRPRIHLGVHRPLAPARGNRHPTAPRSVFARFTELVATAIADSQARDRLAQLAYEQSALRRVAAMVASAPASEQLFSPSLERLQLSWMYPE